MMPHVFSDVSIIDFFSFYKQYYSKIKIIVLNLGKPISPDKPNKRGQCLTRTNETEVTGAKKG
jgi:hypothetical protein